MSKLNDSIKIKAIAGITEIDDVTAAKCSGGYIIKFYSDEAEKKFAGGSSSGGRYNLIAVDRKTDFSIDDSINARSVGIVGEPGATYDLRYTLYDT